MKNTKVAHLTSVHPPFDTRIFKECRTLAEAGFEVTLIAPHDASERVEDVNIRALGKPRSRSERLRKTVLSVYRAALSEGADLYHLHDPELLPVAAFLKGAGKKVLYDMHENTPKQIATKEWIHPALHKVITSSYEGLERLTLPRLPVIFAETSYEQHYAWHETTETVLNMPLVQDLLGVQTPNKASNPPSAVYMGGISEVRGSVVTVEALKLIQERGYELTFECIGPIRGAKHERELADLVSEYKLSNVTFHGYKTPQEGWHIVADCTLGLALMQAVPNHYDSYPTKMFEYMALGLPVIVSDFPLYREVVETERCGLCVDPSDSAAVADAVQWILEHPAEATAMGQRGKEAVKRRYNWAHEAEKLLAFYERLLK